MKIFVGDAEVGNAVEFQMEVVRDFLDPQAFNEGHRVYLPEPREIEASATLPEWDAGPILDAFGNPGRTITWAVTQTWSWRARLWNLIQRWVAPLAVLALMPPVEVERLPQEIKLQVEGMRPIAMRRGGGMVEVRFSNRDLNRS